jgi:hypothetical protein
LDFGHRFAVPDGHPQPGNGLSSNREREQGLQRQVRIGAPFIDPPITRRENRSITTARYTNPSCVRIYVMSVTCHRQAIALNRRQAELIRGIRCLAGDCAQSTRGDIELPVQRSVGHNGRAATVRTGLLFVTNLSPYARQTCQTPSPVGADVFAEVRCPTMVCAAQPREGHRSSCSLPLSAIAAQSPAGQRVSIDFTAVIPSLLQQHRLALILQRPLRKGFAQPGIKAARMNQQHPAHGPACKDQPVLRDERIPHPLPPSRRLNTHLRRRAADVYIRERGGAWRSMRWPFLS